MGSSSREEISYSCIRICSVIGNVHLIRNDGWKFIFFNKNTDFEVLHFEFPKKFMVHQTASLYSGTTKSK
jgi:hypothetical protein